MTDIKRMDIYNSLTPEGKEVVNILRGLSHKERRYVLEVGLYSTRGVQHSCRTVAKL